ncbi:MAG TPA: class I SAM-dependent methyltransferase, partial [Thermoanaerobaculia bacterium]|nr:class I SAM-dependent methyltransferase [Thermoanaerobaculia bacterium]
MNPLGVTERVHLESKPAGEPSIPELKRSLAQYWNERSAGFERAQGIAVERQRAAWLAFLDEALGNPPQKILDVGTGTGFLALLAAELGHEVKGLDLSPGMVERAQELAGERGLKATFAVADAEGLPEPEGTYDRLINRNVLWTLPEPERALADWYRVLKPGGSLVVVDGDWFDDPPSYRVRRFLGSVMTLLATRRNPWAARRRLRRGYDGSFEKHLPLRAPGNRRRYPELIAAAGFADVRLIELAEVDAAEKARLKMAERLVQSNRFF